MSQPEVTDGQAETIERSRSFSASLARAVATSAQEPSAERLEPNAETALCGLV